MNRKITVREIAEHCGVSMATVSRAINGNSYVSPELRKKIREYLEDIGWEPRNLPGTRQTGWSRRWLSSPVWSCWTIRRAPVS